MATQEHRSREAILHLLVSAAPTSVVGWLKDIAHSLCGPELRSGWKGFLSHSVSGMGVSKYKQWMEVGLGSRTPTPSSPQA